MERAKGVKGGHVSNRTCRGEESSHTSQVKLLVFKKFKGLGGGVCHYGARANLLNEVTNPKIKSLGKKK